MSEAHAKRAIASGRLEFQAPDGQPIRVQYERHVLHPDGSWTWIGRAAGARAGQSTVLTFGGKAVFGRIPGAGSRVFSLNMAMGRPWLVEEATTAAHADEAGQAVSDALIPPSALARPVASTTGQPSVAASSGSSVPVPAALNAEPASANSVVTMDLVLGYTTGFASRLGGTSQAMTRLNYLVELANQAFTNSQVSARVRLVRAVEVDYPDATSNRTTLFQLTGVQCTTGTGANLPEGGVRCTAAERPAALQPIIQAREQFGADLVSLVRRYENPENGSCGLGWLLGAGQTSIDSSDAEFAMSLISDTSGTLYPDGGATCREDVLAHEMGHNMGLQHDPASAQGTDDANGDGNLLDPDEYGRFPYSFGYSTGSTAGNFYTVMAVRRSGQSGYLIFANPNSTFCAGNPCGNSQFADNARSLHETVGIIANFRPTVVPLGGPAKSDLDGDGKSDIYWRNANSGQTAWWQMDGSEILRIAYVYREADLRWKVVASGDFNGDARADVLWRNDGTGENFLQLMNGTAVLPGSGPLVPVSDLNWRVAGVGDFDGDRRADIYWRNTSTGQTALWLMDGATRRRIAYVHLEANQAWTVAGIADFNGDGMADVFWRNVATGENHLHLMRGEAIAAGSGSVEAVADLSWRLAAIGDFNGDGSADLYWRNSSDGRNVLWTMAGAARTAMYDVSLEPDQGWRVVGAPDFNGDGKADVLWRHATSGRSYVHLMSGPTILPGSREITPVPEAAWQVVGQ